MKKYLIVFLFLLLPVITQAQKPTPTPMPPAEAPPIDLGSSATWSLWDYTDDMIMMWNYYPPVAPVVQVAIIISLVVVFVYYIISQIRALMDSSE